MISRLYQEQLLALDSVSELFYVRKLKIEIPETFSVLNLSSNLTPSTMIAIYVVQQPRSLFQIF